MQFLKMRRNSEKKIGAKFIINFKISKFFIKPDVKIIKNFAKIAPIFYLCKNVNKMSQFSIFLKFEKNIAKLNF